MKTSKIILLVTAISLLTSAPYGVANARDCSNAKGFHAKLMCKLTGSSSNSGSSASSVESKGDGTGSWIKKFLGKKNNEVTGR